MSDDDKKKEDKDTLEFRGYDGKVKFAEFDIEKWERNMAPHLATNSGRMDWYLQANPGFK